MKKLFSMLLVMAMILGTALADEASETHTETFETTLSDVPDIPTGTFSASVRSFPGKQRFPVYSAPSAKSLRGANKRAVVSTNDWIQVFGAEDDWLMVQYDISDTRYRIGYITRDALPTDVTVPELSLKPADAIAAYDVVVTDDPLLSKEKLTILQENQKVTCLGIMGDWSYIEGKTAGKYFRGFVPTEALSGVVSNLEEARYALSGNWSLYAGTALIAENVTFHEDGSMIGRTTSNNSTVNEWSGNWSLSEYDSARDRYWNDPEFELCLTHDGMQQFFGLRICRRPNDNGDYTYALILADKDSSSGMVLCNE